MTTLYTRLKSSTRQIPYYCGSHLQEDLNHFLQRDFAGYRVFVLADSNITRLYRDFGESLHCHPRWLTFPAGEDSKSLARMALLQDELLHQRAGRDSLLIAMGGGVTGDLVGFVAATLQRGVPLVHLPTSLLAQVDSSVGGKVGINHPMGKNLLGAFYHPAAIFSDSVFLKTLPEREFYNGMAEVIKYAVVLDDELWQWLEEERPAILQRDEEVLQKIIQRCAGLKMKVVEADEREGDYRSLLNYGHTVGHALETLSNYEIPHGYAVAAGMKVAAMLSRQLLGYPEERVERLFRLLQDYHLDEVSLQTFSEAAIWEAISSDKKSRKQQPRFTLMADAGKPVLFYSIERQDLDEGIRAAQTLC